MAGRVDDSLVGGTAAEINGGSATTDATGLGVFSFSLNFAGSGATGVSGSASLKRTGRAAAAGGASIVFGAGANAGESGAGRGCNVNGEAGFSDCSADAATTFVSAVASERSNLGRSLSRGASASTTAASAMGAAGGT